MDEHLADAKWRVARLAADILYSRGARNVWIFGSLAMGSPVDQHTDLDIVVDGLPLAIFTKTRQELNQMCNCKVDLVEFERASPALRPHILRTRLLLPRTRSK